VAAYSGIKPVGMVITVLFCDAAAGEAVSLVFCGLCGDAVTDAPLEPPVPLAQFASIVMMYAHTDTSFNKFFILYSFI
jgi:hypothetical protein